VPEIWKGGECWIIGGGPSVPRQFDVPEKVINDVLRKTSPLSIYSPYMKAIHNKHVIGVNAAFFIGTWIDMLFFGDKGFYLPNQKEIREFPKLKVTCSDYFSKPEWKGIKYLARDKKGMGISNNPSTVCWNVNSGAAAISVAANMGCKRIILLGFDMNVGEKSEMHWHAHYRKAGELPKNLPFHRHMRGFTQVKKDAKRRKIEIINASPNSALPHFKKAKVKDLI
jgi:hypothetical protein